MTDALIGPYRIVRKLSAGGMGTVYEAIHDAIERRVAIKILHPQHVSSAETVRRFFNEAKAANRIDHPGIVQIHDCGQLPDGTSFIVMEFLKGETLGKRLRRARTRRLLPQNLRLMAQVAEALAAAHAAGIIHRDMKPDNVMVIGDPNSSVGERTKILDFGIAKLRTPGGGNSVTKDNLLGTPTYMSPEQCRGSSVIEPATDVYAVGIMLYRLVAARPPFVASGAGEVLAMHMFQAPTPLKNLAPWVPDDLAEFIHKLLAKEPSERPAMQEVAQRLAAFSKALENFVVPSEEDDTEGDPAASHTDLDTGGVMPTLTSGGIETPPSWRDWSHSGAGTPSSSSLGSGLQKTTQPSIATVSGQKQTDAPAKKRLGMVPVIAIGVGAVAAAAVLALSLSRGSSQKSGAAGMNPPPQLAAPVRVHWKITSTPAGAELQRVQDGALIGITPWQGEQDSLPGVELIRIQAAGFQPQTLSLRRDHDSEHAILLAAKMAPVVDDKPAVVKTDESSAKKTKTGRIRKEHREEDKPDSADTSKPKLKATDVLED